jgi:uncharacterized protein YndB with AHSA1/START domain
VIDITNEIDAIEREVSRRQGPDGEEVAVLIRRSYDAPNAEVWDALTDPERMKRWFYPVSGDFRVGGTFQLEGNAGGEIRRCEPPRLLEVTFGGPTSLVELRLSPDGEDRTMLELEHTVPIALAMSGAGSLYVGPGWDGAAVRLSRRGSAAPTQGLFSHDRSFGRHVSPDAVRSHAVPRKIPLRECMAATHWRCRLARAARPRSVIV